ncbi:DUF4118 domain-containing protein [Rhodopseudomonas palustris]|nr:DUF4118 domain-containing protein [Rhodopseudomonas palustris]
MRRWRTLYRRGELHWLGAFLLAIICVALATVARILLGLLGPTLAFATFFPAVMVCALVGGWRPGLLAILLSVGAVWWAFIEPNYAFGPVSHVMVANFIVFSVSSLAVIWLALVHRQAVFDLEDHERERQMLVNEVQHRSKNLVAVIGSIVRQTVTDKSERDAVLNRMNVIAGSTDPLEVPKGMGLREVLDIHVCKAHGEQIVLNGDDIALTAIQSRGLALVFHEMMTNAVKYGALSKREGRVKIDWTHADRVLRIVWCEIDGPLVSEPAKFNFGSKLIASMLDQIGAKLEPTFAKTGYCYSISVPDTDHRSLVE